MRNLIPRILRWGFTFTTCVSLAGWWFTVHYLGYINTAPTVIVGNGVIELRGMSHIRLSCPPTGERARYDKYDGEWGFTLPKFSRLPEARVNDCNGVPVTVPATESLIIPAWLPSLTSALMAAWLWKRARTVVPSNHCSKCRYNLTGNTTGVCPECGLAIPVRPPTSISI